MAHTQAGTGGFAQTGPNNIFDDGVSGNIGLPSSLGGNINYGNVNEFQTTVVNNIDGSSTNNSSYIINGTITAPRITPQTNNISVDTPATQSTLNNGIESSFTMMFGSTLQNRGAFTQETNDLLLTYTDKKRHESLYDNLSNLKNISFSQTSNVFDYVEVNRPMVLDNNDIITVHQDIYGNDKYENIFTSADGSKFGLATISDVDGTYNAVNLSYIRLFRLGREVIPTTYYVYRFDDLINNEVSYKHYTGATETINGVIYGSEVPYYENLVQSDTVSPESLEILAYDFACLNNELPIVLKEYYIPKLSFKTDNDKFVAYNVSLVNDLVLPGYILSYTDNQLKDKNKTLNSLSEVRDAFNYLITNYTLNTPIQVLETYKDKRTKEQYLNIKETTLFVPVKLTTSDNKYQPYELVNSISNYRVVIEASYDDKKKQNSITFTISNSADDTNSSYPFLYDDNEKWFVYDNKLCTVIRYKGVPFAKLDFTYIDIYFNVSSLVQNEQYEYVEYYDEPFLSPNIQDNIVNILTISDDDTNFIKVELKSEYHNNRIDADNGILAANNDGDEKDTLPTSAVGEMYLRSKEEIKVNPSNEELYPDLTYFSFMQAMSSSYNIQYVANYDKLYSYKFIDGVSSIEYKKDRLFTREGIEMAYTYWSPARQSYVRYDGDVLNFKDNIYGTNIYDYIEATYNSPKITLVELFERTRTRDNLLIDYGYTSLAYAPNIATYLQGNNETILNTYSTTPFILANEYDYEFAGYSFVEPTRSYIINCKTTTAIIFDSQNEIVKFVPKRYIRWGGDDGYYPNDFKLYAYSISKPFGDIPDDDTSLTYVDIIIDDSENIEADNNDDDVIFSETTMRRNVSNYYLKYFYQEPLFSDISKLYIASEASSEGNENGFEDIKFTTIKSVQYYRGNTIRAVSSNKLGELNNVNFETNEQRRNAILHVLMYFRENIKAKLVIPTVYIETELGVIAIEDKQAIPTDNESEIEFIIANDINVQLQAHEPNAFQTLSTSLSGVLMRKDEDGIELNITYLYQCEEGKKILEKITDKKFISVDFIGDVSNDKNITYNYFVAEYEAFKLSERNMDMLTYYTSDVISQDGYWKRNYDKQIKPFVTLSYTYVNNSLDISNAYIVPTTKNEVLGFIHQRKITYNEYEETLYEEYKYTYFNDVTNLQQLFVEDDTHTVVDLGNNQYYGMVRKNADYRIATMEEGFIGANGKTPNDIASHKIANTYPEIEAIAYTSQSLDKLTDMFDEFIVNPKTASKLEGSAESIYDYYNSFYTFDNNKISNFKIYTYYGSIIKVVNNNFSDDYNLYAYFVATVESCANSKNDDNKLSYVEIDTKVIDEVNNIRLSYIFVFDTINQFLGYDELTIGEINDELLAFPKYFKRIKYKVEPADKPSTIKLYKPSWQDVVNSRMQNLLCIPTSLTDIIRLYRRLTISKKDELKEHVLQEDSLVPQCAQLDTPFSLVNGKKVNVIDQIYVPETYVTVMDIDPDSGEYFTKRVLQTDAYMSYTYEIEDIPFMTATYVFNGGDEGLKIQGFDNLIDYLSNVVVSPTVVMDENGQVTGAYTTMSQNPNNYRPLEKSLNTYLSKVTYSLVYINEALDRSTKNLSYALAYSTDYTYSIDNLGKSVTKLGSLYQTQSMSNTSNTIDAQKVMVTRLTDAIDNQTEQVTRMMALTTIAQSGYTTGKNNNVFQNVFSNMLSSTPKNWQVVEKIGYQTITYEETSSYISEGYKHTKVITKGQHPTTVREVKTNHKYDKKEPIRFAYTTAFDVTSSNIERIGLHLNRESRDFTYNGYLYHEDYYTYQNIADILADLHVSTRIPNRREFIVDVSKRLYINSDFIFSYTSPNEYAKRAIRRADILWTELVAANIVNPEEDNIRTRPLPSVEPDWNAWWRDPYRMSAFAYAFNVDLHKLQGANKSVFDQLAALVERSKTTDNRFRNDSSTVEEIMGNTDKQDSVEDAFGTELPEETLTQINDLVEEYQNDTPPEENEYVEVEDTNFVEEDTVSTITKKEDDNNNGEEEETEDTSDIESEEQQQQTHLVASYQRTISEFMVTLTREGILTFNIPTAYNNKVKKDSTVYEFRYTFNNENPIYDGENTHIVLVNSLASDIDISELPQNGVIRAVFVDNEQGRVSEEVKLLYRKNQLNRFTAPYITNITDVDRDPSLPMILESHNDYGIVLLGAEKRKVQKESGYCGTILYYEYIYDDVLQLNALKIDDAVKDKYKSLWTQTSSEVQFKPNNKLYIRTTLVELDKTTGVPNPTYEPSANVLGTSDVSIYTLGQISITKEELADKYGTPLFYYNPNWSSQQYYDKKTTNEDFK